MVTKYKITQLLAVAVCLAASQSAQASLIITPTFASSITSDPNAAAIEGAINQAISFYENTFTSSVNIFITFQEGGGLGGSSTWYFNVSYKQYYDALVANADGPTEALALAQLNAMGGDADTNGGVNPVTGGLDINVKTANLRALGIATPGHGDNSSDPDGTITLNTSLTTPGSTGSSLQYSLLAVTEHEMDEVLGLGSALPNTTSGTGTLSIAANAPFSSPFPEDLFRYSGTNTLATSVNCASPGSAYFSINGTTMLDQFNNACNGGDFADWASGANPPNVGPQVQDAFGTPGATVSLGPGSLEVTALEAIGYAVPEPATWLLSLGGLALGAGYRFLARGGRQR